LNAQALSLAKRQRLGIAADTPPRAQVRGYRKSINMAMFLTYLSYRCLLHAPAL